MPRAGGQEGANWTEERMELLRAMALTYSASKIAEAFGCGFTRNMVLGKCRRMQIDLKAWSRRPPALRRQKAKTEIVPPPQILSLPPPVEKRWKPGGILVRAGWLGW